MELLNARAALESTGVSKARFAQSENLLSARVEINAKIVAKNARIYGRVNGDISCTSFLELCSGAKVSGNIVSPRLVMEEGVVFEGYCMMHEAQRLVQDEEKRQRSAKAEVIELSDDDSPRSEDSDAKRQLEFGETKKKVVDISSSK